MPWSVQCSVIVRKVIVVGSQAAPILAKVQDNTTHSSPAPRYFPQHLVSSEPVVSKLVK